MTLNTSQKNEIIDKIQRACILAIFGFLLYYGSILVAALLYPGGYNFYTNYFSDLGRTVTPEGNDNIFSVIFFVSGTTVTGLLFIPFWTRYYTIFSSSTFSRKVARLGSAFGVFVIPSLFGIALIPINIWLDLHAIFSFAYYLTISLSLLCYSLSIILDPFYPSKSGYMGVLIVLFELLFIIGIFSEIEPFIQKLTSLCFFCWFVVQYVILSRGLNSSDNVITS